MLRPAYLEVMDSIDKRGHIDQDLRSRYIVVIAAAKRARQLIDGAEPQTNSVIKKDVSIAVQEIYQNKLDISPMTPEQIEEMENGEELEADSKLEDEEVVTENVAEKISNNAVQTNIE